MTDMIVYYLVLALFAAFALLLRSYLRLRSGLSEALSRKQSLSVRYGKMTEQFFPFLADYPYDPQRFRFLGSPIDGVQFNDDSVVFIEFKAAGSALSHGQKKIRDLIDEKKVKFEEIRIPSKG